MSVIVAVEVVLGLGWLSFSCVTVVGVSVLGVSVLGTCSQLLMLALLALLDILALLAMVFMLLWLTDSVMMENED